MIELHTRIPVAVLHLADDTLARLHPFDGRDLAFAVEAVAELEGLTPAETEALYLEVLRGSARFRASYGVSTGLRPRRDSESA